MPKSPSGRQSTAVRRCPQEVPGTVPDVRGHEGGIWAQSGRLLGCTQNCNTRGSADWEERQDLREEPCFRLEDCEGGKPWGCGRGARDPWRGVVETNSSKEGSGLMEDLSRLASEDSTLVQALISHPWTWLPRLQTTKRQLRVDGPSGHSSSWGACCVE